MQLYLEDILLEWFCHAHVNCISLDCPEVKEKASKALNIGNVQLTGCGCFSSNIT